MIREIKNLRKKIIYRSQKRGFLESEIILERFIKQFLATMKETELEMLDLLLSHDDTQIISWLHQKETPPEKLETLIKNINSTLRS